jgi:hypothetical protein
MMCSVVSARMKIKEYRKTAVIPSHGHHKKSPLIGGFYLRPSGWVCENWINQIELFTLLLIADRLGDSGYKHRQGWVIIFKLRVVELAHRSAPVRIA